MVLPMVQWVQFWDYACSSLAPMMPYLLDHTQVHKNALQEAIVSEKIGEALPTSMPCLLFLPLCSLKNKDGRIFEILNMNRIPQTNYSKKKGQKKNYDNFE